MNAQRLNQFLIITALMLVALLGSMLLFPMRGKVPAAIYWQVGKILSMTGHDERAQEWSFQSTCASMQWSKLSFSLTSAAECNRLNTEVWRFFNKNISSIPNLKVETWINKDQLHPDVIVTYTAEKQLREYLRLKGFTPL